MTDVVELLGFARGVVSDAAASLADVVGGGRIVGRELGEREVKIAADAILNDRLLAALEPSGLPVLSEESPAAAMDVRGTYWILDPLDGSYNFARELGPAMISLALMIDGRPVIGVLRDVLDGSEYWGGSGHGAFRDGSPIAVSGESSLSRSVLFTGFPSRFPVGDATAMARHSNRMARFGKVRMIGSAAAALVRVARGSAEAFVESRIMSWDVAAGLALIEGAGGSVSADFSTPFEPMDVTATNGRVDPDGT